MTAEHLIAALGDDPITVAMLALAVVYYLVALFFRRGGITAPFVIRSFAAAATVGAVLKAGTWLLSFVLPIPQLTIAPSGTDIILLIGGFVAIFGVAIADAIQAFDTDPTPKDPKPSLATRAWQWTTRQLGWDGSPSQPTGPLSETDAALTDRKARSEFVIKQRPAPVHNDE